MTEKQILCQAVGSRMNLPMAWVDLELLQSSYAVGMKGVDQSAHNIMGRGTESHLPSSKEAACFRLCISTVDCGVSSK